MRIQFYIKVKALLDYSFGVYWMEMSIQEEEYTQFLRSFLAWGGAAVSALLVKAVLLDVHPPRFLCQEHGLLQINSSFSFSS